MDSAHPRELLPIAAIKPPGEVQFRDTKIPAPANTDTVLTQSYGPSDITLPPEADRKPTHFRNGLVVDFGDRREVILPG